MALCEWDPDSDRLATVDEGCGNDAVVSVGADGQFHLCESCAGLPVFNRYRRLVAIPKKSSKR